MSFILPPLPYEKTSLSPYISEETLRFHHEKHHNIYVLNLNALVKKNKIEKKSLEEIIKTETGSIYNNAAQIFNHTFYWYSMSPTGGGEPNGDIKRLIEINFDTFSNFKKTFTNIALSFFGSGWIWLIKDKNDSITIETTKDALCPIYDDRVLIFNCDLWEHAYYIDYRNSRLDYLNNWWNVINWDFANQNIK